jgi:hypothetical protein
MTTPAPPPAATAPSPTPAGDSEPSYIDYETFLSPAFHPPTFANTLLHQTNNPTDPAPLDLSTPLSRVLFDAQEIDSHIDRLTTRQALPLLGHTERQNAASGRVAEQVEAQLRGVNEGFEQLRREVGEKYEEADEVRVVVGRVWEVLRLGRAVGRVVQLGRRAEVQWAEVRGGDAAAGLGATKGREDHRALGRCVYTLLGLREMFAAEGDELERVAVVRTLRESVVGPVEKAARETAEKMVREFSMGSASGAATFAQSEEVRARTVSAVTALYLLTPVDTGLAGPGKWAPKLMLQALEVYLRSALQSSIAGLSRALATLPSLERTLAEVSARCQNVVALEAVLEGTKAPEHPLLPPGKQPGGNMLQPLLAYLETGSLASYFWRTMAGSMAPRVQEIVAKGGVSARTLRSNRQSVGEAIKDCVARGSQLPSPVAAAAKGKARANEADAAGKHWEREVAVMVGSIVNNLGR